MSKVALIDYGSGNLRSAEKALAVAASRSPRSHQIVVTHDPETVASADALVLPGVGAFAACMSLLHGRDGLIEAMGEAANKKGSPFLGICVGMQLLATRGLEFGETAGLGWIAGDVRKLESHDLSRPRERGTPRGWRGQALKVPHMGWNALRAETGHALTKGAPNSAHVYFTHSFVLDPADEADVIAYTDHGGPIVAAVARGNIAGFQFHPEKSQAVGLRLLGDFLEWRP